MEFISPSFRVGFMKYRLAWAVLSAALVVASIFVWIKAGQAKYGVDFLGGTVVHVKFDRVVDAAEMRKILDDGGLHGSIVQAFIGQPQELSVRLPSTGEGGSEVGKKVRELLAKVENTKHEVLQEEYVGPIIGSQIKRDAVKAVLISILGIMLYVSFRFHWTYALGGIIALLHDTIVMTGAVVFTGREFSAAILAAVLTIIGFSINDTIIVFDRVRENLNAALKTGGDKGNKRIKALREMNMVELVDHSVNETLSRTILTSATVFFVSFCLWQFGGGAVSDMAFALTVGVVAGTYSSIYIACASMLLFQGQKKQPLRELAKAA